MLMPAAVLVLVVLGSIAVDSARLFLAQRELVDAAAAAANDAAGAALEDGAFYRAGGRLSIDPVQATRVAEAAVAARAPAGLALGAPQVLVTGRQVCVVLRASVEPLFARAIPGAAGARTVTARASATAAGGVDGVGVPVRGLC
jgi:hypothetical protein